MALHQLYGVAAQLGRQVFVVRLVEHDKHALGHTLEEGLDRLVAREGAGRIVGIRDPGDIGLVVDCLRHRLQVVAIVLRRHDDRARAARLRGERIHREAVLREHRRAAGAEEGERDQLKHVVRAVAEHDRARVDAVALRERLLELEAVAVGVARDLADRRLDRGAGARADAARVLVRRELHDRALVQPHLARELGDRLAGLVGRDRAHVRRREFAEIH
jgi:hypothetical protein